MRGAPDAAHHRRAAKILRRRAVRTLRLREIAAGLESLGLPEEVLRHRRRHAVEGADRPVALPRDLVRLTAYGAREDRLLTGSAACLKRYCNPGSLPTSYDVDRDNISYFEVIDSRYQV